MEKCNSASPVHEYASSWTGHDAIERIAVSAIDSGVTSGATYFSYSPGPLQVIDIDRISFGETIHIIQSEVQLSIDSLEYVLLSLLEYYSFITVTLPFYNLLVHSTKNRAYPPLLSESPSSALID